MKMSCNVKEEADKLFNELQEKINAENGQLNPEVKVFIEAGIFRGILLAGMSLVNFENIE